jgi:hypothetical protein
MQTRWINAAMGALLVCAGVLAQGAERATDLALGLSVFVVAFLAMASARARRVNTVLGAWAVLSPFVLASPDAAPGWIALGAGAVIVVASLWPDRPPARAHPAGQRAG